MSATPVVTRFAPSPTGFLHIGGARTALFSWLLARHFGGTFILRVEDTDLQRSTPEATQAILDGMTWLGMDCDQGPFFQSQRFDLYNEGVEQLLASGKAYWCGCTPEEVDAMREEAKAKGLKPKYAGKCREAGLGPGPGRCVRFKAPLDGAVVWEDLVKGHIRVEVAELDDMVIRRADGSPTYNMAVVMDDATMNVTHVLRGDDHVSNTPKQILLYEALGKPVPRFGHVPMILGPDKKKLSKRHGAESVMEWRDLGYLPEAMVNYLVRLSWSHGDQEVFTTEELIRYFDGTSLGSSAAVFNPEKLMWLNSEYIKKSAPGRLAKLVDEAGQRKGSAPLTPEALTTLTRAVPLFQPRARTILEMLDMAGFLIADTPNSMTFDEKAVAKFLIPEALDRLDEVADVLASVDDFTPAGLEAAMNCYLESAGLAFKAVAQPMRVALTGKTVSPGLYEVMEVLGKERTIARLKAARTL